MPWTFDSFVIVMIWIINYSHFILTAVAFRKLSPINTYADASTKCGINLQTGTGNFSGICVALVEAASVVIPVNLQVKIISAFFKWSMMCNKRGGIRVIVP